MSKAKLANKTNGLLNFQDYKKVRFKVIYGVIIFLLILAVFTALIPIFWLMVTSFKTVDEINDNVYHFFPKVFDITKVFRVWQKANFLRYFINSIIVTVGAVISSVLFNGLLAYAVTIVKPKGHKIVNTMVMVSYMIPAVTAIIPLFQNIVSLNLTNSYIPLMLVFGANAFYYVNFKNYFKTIPSTLFEAAKLDGCSDFRIFRSIVVPLSRPIIGVVAIFAMTASWSDFLLPYLVLNDTEMYTVMVDIFTIGNNLGNGSFTYDEFLMLLMISILPQIVFFFIFQKQITNSQNSSGLKD